MKWIKNFFQTIIKFFKKEFMTNPLPRNQGQLDHKKISRIWILTDENGTPILVLAEGFNGELFSESYSPALNSLIIGSGIPCITAKASVFFGRYLLVNEMQEKASALDSGLKAGNSNNLG